MLDKLERAVASISDNSNRVALVLERHENRLDKNEDNADAILKLVEKVEEKIDAVEKRVNDLSRFRWISVGVITAALVLLKVVDISSPLTTPGPSVSIPGVTPDRIR